MSVIVFSAFYLSIGVGTILKFHGELDFSLIARFILFLPLQTIITFIMIYWSVLREILADRRYIDMKGNGAFKFVYLLWTVLFTCIQFLPVFSGSIAQVSINNKRTPKYKIIERTKNDCATLVSSFIMCNS